VIPNPEDIKMQKKLFYIVWNWLKSGTELHKKVSLLNGFEFNEQQQPVQELWKAPYYVCILSPNRLQIYFHEFVPKESIVAPPNTSYVICRLAVAVCDINKGGAISSTSASLMFDYKLPMIPPQNFIFRIAMPKGSLVAIAMSLQFQQVMLDPWENLDPVKTPSGIVDVMIV
jgi:hypothetical protein